MEWLTEKELHDFIKGNEEQCPKNVQEYDQWQIRSQCQLKYGQNQLGITSQEDSLVNGDQVQAGKGLGELLQN